MFISQIKAPITRFLGYGLTQRELDQKKNSNEQVIINLVAASGIMLVLKATKIFRISLSFIQLTARKPGSLGLEEAPLLFC